METAVRIWGTIVEYKGVVGRPVLPLPLVKLVGALLYILVTACRERPRTEQSAISTTLHLSSGEGLRKRGLGQLQCCCP